VARGRKCVMMLMCFSEIMLVYFYSVSPEDGVVL
jgi:hypothetical protein